MDYCNILSVIKRISNNNKKKNNNNKNDKIKHERAWKTRLYGQTMDIYFKPILFITII